MLDRENGYYQSQEILPGLWYIDDAGQDNLYLIVGSQKALLFDTGFGAGALKDFVASITPLPVIVVNSHAHLDHACGNNHFGNVYAGEADLALLSPAEDLEERRAFVIHTRDHPVKYSPLFSTRFGVPGCNRSLPVYHGQVFDLGGRSVSALATPGHTAGSICLLDENSATLLAGDSFVPNEAWGPMWLHLEESVTMQEMTQSLRLMRGCGATGVVSGHGACNRYAITALDSVITLAQDIANTVISGVPVTTYFGDGLLAERDDAVAAFIFNDKKRK